MAPIAKLYAEVGADTSKFDRAMDGVDNKLRSTGGAFSSLGGIMTSVFVAGAVAAVAGIGALTFAIGKSVEAAADMEQGIADIASVMNLTSEETEQLGGLIQDLGLDPKLKVTATEASEAINNLATAGLTMDEIMGGAARSTILLANATGNNFGGAATIATDAMAQFNIKAEDMAGAVDQIVGVTNVSKFTIDDYGLALAQAGGVAASVGVSFDDFNATIAAISPLFASGSDAGTSYKTFLQRLIPQSDEAAAAMTRLGLFSGMTTSEFEKAQGKLEEYQNKLIALDPTTENYAEKAAELTAKINVLRGSLVEGSNAFFTADGDMRSMAEVAGILQQATAGLSDEQKNETLSTIFGTDAMRAAFAVAGMTTEQFDAMKTKLGDTSAEEAAATRMDTLRGSWEIFNGIVETLSIQIGQQFLPLARNLSDWMGEAATRYGPDIVLWFGRIATVVDRILAGFSDPGWQAFFGSFGEAWPGIARIASESSDSITASISRIEESMNRLSALFGGEDSSVQSRWARVWEGLVGVVSWAATSTINAVANILDALALVGDAMSAVGRGDWGALAGLSGRAGDLAGNIAQNSLGGKLGTYLGEQFGRPFVESMFPGRAGGGAVTAGSPYLVGERGAELFMPNQAGSVLDAETLRRLLSGSGGGNTTFNITVAGGDSAAATVRSTVGLMQALYG